MKTLKKLFYFCNGGKVRNQAGYNLVSQGRIASDVSFVRPSLGTYFDATGILKTAGTNIPRFTYNPTTLTYQGLLLEGARTNKFLQGTNLTSWAKASNNTLTLNSLVSPDGTTNAAHLIPDNTSGQHWLGGANNPAITAGANWSISGYFKRNGNGTNNRYFRFTMRNSDWSGVAGFDVDLVNGTIQATTTGTGTVGSVSITNVGNGWYRCVANNCYTSATNTAIIVEGFFMTSFAGSSTTTGDGVNGVGLWGMQFEEATFATSFIPTTTTATTRSTDVCTVTSLSAKPWFCASKGTIFADFQRNAEMDQFSNACYVSDGTATDTNDLRIAQGAAVGSRNFIATSKVSGTEVATFSISSGNANISAKTAFAYNTNDFAFCVNNGTVSTHTTGALPNASLMEIGNGATVTPLFGTIKNLTYYPKRLANNILQKITT